MTQWENDSIIAMALTHFPALVIFSFLVAVVFGVLAKEAPRERFVYGAKVFGVCWHRPCARVVDVLLS
jgi:uncharacterized membrane protein YagU involved in acid resistance